MKGIRKKRARVKLPINKPASWDGLPHCPKCGTRYNPDRLLKGECPRAPCPLLWSRPKAKYFTL